MNGKIGAILKFAAAIVFVCNAASAAAQPVRFIVPYPPGGTSDLFSRILGQKMAESMGNQVIIDNRPGAGGTIGLEMLILAPADSTIGMLNTQGLISALAFRPDLLQKFQLVSLLGISGMAIVSSKDATIADLAERAKRAQQFGFGSTGTGSLAHICFEQFLKGVGRQGQAVHTAYKGTAPLLVDLISGGVEVACVNIAGAFPHIRAGKLRALAVTLPHDQLPGIPTLESAGVQGVLAGSWYSVIAPKGMSRTTLNSMVAGLKQALSDNQVKIRLREITQGELIPADDMGPEIANQFVQRQIARLRPYVSLIPR